MDDRAALVISFRKDCIYMSDDRKKIRFIDSRYHDLFQIYDGESIEIKYPDRETVKRKCTFIDEYHTKIGMSVYHICEFAEKMEAIGATYQAANEPVKNNTHEKRSATAARSR